MSDNFSQAMAGLSIASAKSDTEDGECSVSTSAPPTVIDFRAVYPWSKLSAGTTVCDVGGGKGQVVLALLKGHPGLKAIIQDLPQVAVQGREFWNEQFPEAVAEERIQFIPLDFMNDAPVADCGVYHVRPRVHVLDNFQ